MKRQIQLNTQAMMHLKAGRFSDAEALCVQVLKQAPKQFDTLNILAGVRAAQGKVAEAVEVMNLAVAASPQMVDGYVTRAQYLQQLGRLPEALEDCEKAVALKPEFGAALLAKGAVLMQLKDFTSAFTVFEHASQLQPNVALPLFRMGDIYFHLRRYGEAVEYYDKALKLTPKSVELIHNRALALIGLEQFDDALVAANTALVFAPKLAALHFVRGRALQNLHRFEDALEAYETAVTHNPNHYDAHHNRTSVLRALGHYDQALAASQAALALRPQSAESYDNYAHCLLAVGREKDAFAAFDQAVRFAPGTAAIINNRSNALFVSGHYAEALEGLDKAIALEPKSAIAHSSRGLVLQALGRHLHAKISFDRAIEIEPNSPFVQFNKATHRLLHADFAQGWPLYESRWNLPDQPASRGFTQPLWLGDAEIQGKTILLHTEQGLGDSIQFCRYVTMVESLGARVILEAPESLLKLLSSMPGERTLIARGEELPAFDLHCPLMSLPLAFNTTLETIPNAVPYLAASADAKAHWVEQLGTKKRPRIGVTWSGAAHHKNDLNRSMPIETLAPLLALNADFHALQKEVRPEDTVMIASGMRVTTYGSALTSMDETAGLIDAMDLIIAVDTSTAHLAGALGKPTWILLPFAPDFRWLLERSDTPWYPTAKLVRQPAIGQWDPVIDQLIHYLQPVLS